ncbi:hypothetical protein CDD83_3274 [Cordyceps sp. RAO-2017]|nr:hypothetical protein CDD83_3274 [Cordyceps sp. RAO-2017]
MMNADIDGSAAMEQDPALAQCNGYGNDSWVGMGPYGHGPYDSSSMNEYAGFAHFMSHGLSESMSGMPLASAPPQSNQPQQQHLQQQHQHLQLIQPAPPPQMCHHQLPLLNTAWPSQLTNPTPTSSAGSYSAPPLPMTPASGGPPQTPAPAPAPAPSIVPPTTPVKGSRPSQTPDVGKPPGQLEKMPRKTLSAEQKRAMCQYHDENPGTRQADIGAKFGVERSTVSKVLRHRDQYLKREQEPDFAFKRAKGKHPDFDRTLSNYVRRQQQRGFDIKDEEIMEQARLFARASGNQEGLLGTLTPTWLQKFKQKHGIGSGRLMRRASEANIPDSARMSTAPGAAGKAATPSVISPVSPTQPLSPLSGSRSDEDLHKDTIEFELTYRAQGSKPARSPGDDGRDGGAAALSVGTMSPAGSFNFSPDPNVGAFQVDHHAPQAEAADGAEPHLRDKRSRTFPSLDVNFAARREAAEALAEPLTPRHAAPVASSPSSSVQSPASELRAIPFTIDTSLASPPPLHRTNSNSSMTGRSSGTPVTTTAVCDASPDSPTYEEARHAANTLLSFIQKRNSNGQFEQSEYLAVVQLTKKLQLHQYQTARPSIGGLSRIPEGDHELAVSADAAMEVR